MIKFIQEIRGKNPKEKRSLTLKSIYILLFCLVLGVGKIKAQIYFHNFGTTSITSKPYTGAPGTFATNLSNSSWTTSASAWSALAGNGGGSSMSLSLSNSSGTPTYTLTFDVASGFQVAITHFNFWRQRSASGAQNWAMTINGTSVGSGTVPTTGALLGSTAVTNARNGLTGTITVVITFSGATSTGTLRLDDFTLTGSVTSTATPAITLNDNSQITSGNINQGATNQILSQFSAVVTDADATLNSLTFNAGGTFIAGDLTNFKLYTNTTNTFPGGSALSTASAGSIANSNAVTFSGLSQANVIGTRYYWITTDVAGSGTSSNTVNVPSLSNSNFTFASGTVSGTITAGGSQTIQAVTPNISINSNHPISGSINQNSTNQVIGSLSLAITNTNATLSSFTVTTSGTYNISDLVASSFKLYYTSSNSFSTSTPLGSAQAIVASGNTITFSGLNQTIINGSTGYLWVTCDVAYNAVSANTISLTSTAFSNLTFVSGNLSGTNPVAASNNMTIATVIPSIAIAFIGPSAGVADIPTTSLILNQFSMATSLNSADLNSITATLGGTYIAADLTSNSFKLWYNTFNTFGTATQIGSSQAIVTTGNSITFSSLAQKLNIGSTGYFWITVDVSGSATNGNTIFVDANAFSNIVFSNANKTGTDPIAAGGTKTFTTQVIAGEIVINQFSPQYSGASNEYIELVNLSNKTIDLSTLKIQYQSASGGNGGAGGNLSGTLLPGSFWLLSPDATITVGQTSSLSRDGSITSGFSATAGQLSISRISDNVKIDGLAYGTITANNLGEGTPSSAPTSNGGLKRSIDGADAGANSTDFSSVTNASIYLRNSGSRLGITGSSIAAGTYRDLTITGNTDLSGAVNITNKVEVLSGTLTTNGNLILKSNASGTASIGNSTGSISGNVTVERYIPRRRAFRFLASPVNTSNFISGSWQQATHITGSSTGANGFDQSNSGTASLFTYNASSEAWAAIPNTNSTNLNIGTGYRMLIRGDRNINLNTTTPQDSAALVLSATGSIVTGNVVFGAGSVSSSPAGIPALNASAGSGANNSTVGWSLIGNPYACAVDWANVTKSNVSSTFATWNVNNAGRGSYVYHTGSVATGNGASSIINSGQSIFVQTTAANPSITFTEASKVTSTPPSHFKKSLSDVLNIDIFIGDRAYDALTVMFDANTSNNYDVQDFIKLVNPEINFYSFLVDGTKLAMNSLKEITSETIVPLGLNGVFNGGSYELKFSNQNTFANSNVYLKDKFINKTYDLKSINNLTFNVTADSNSFGENRFELIFSKSATALNNELSSNNNNFIVFPNPANNVLNLSLTTTKEDNYSFTIFNQLGEMVNNGSLDFNAKRTHALNIENLSNGVYFIQVKNGKTAQTIKFIK